MKFIAIIFAFYFALLIPEDVVRAVPSVNPTNPSPSGSGLLNPLAGGTDLFSFMFGILDFITLKIAPIIIILMLVYIGFLFATSSVQPSNKENARKALLWTLLGALLLLGAEAIALGIKATIESLSI